jgi:phage terminase large subunit
LCARELQASIKDSVHKLLSDQIDALGLSGFYEIQQANIKGANGTEFAFAGLRSNVTQIKSFEGVDICWVEEAQTVSKASWNVLIPTIRKEGSEIWVTFNPDLEEDETYQRFVLHPPTGAVVEKINWSDNPWFPSVLRDEMEALKARDEQAYLNVWEGLCRKSVDGAIFANELVVAELENRLTNVPYDPSKPVHCIWDLGWADNVAIWFLQMVGMEYRLIRYMEDSQKTISHYLAERQKFGYVFDTDWLPHDAQNKTLAANGKSIEEIVRATGAKVRVIPRTSIVDSINAARTIFGACWFDRENCADGIQCLRHYQYEVDPDTKMFSKAPLHNWASHGADAFRMIGLMVKEPKRVKPQKTFEVPIGWMG